MKKIFLKIVNLFYPITCSSCGKDLIFTSQTRICGMCKSSFSFIKGHICQMCGKPLSSGGEFCYECKKNSKRRTFDKMCSVYEYKGSVRKLILKFKYSNRTFLAKDFAADMYETMKNNDFYQESDFIISVPLNTIRKIRRGYNQSELLADELSIKANIPVLKNVLFRKKITKPQFKLSRVERFENIKNSFFVKNKELIRGKNILLIDDIITTASTLSACSSALKFCGADKIFILTLAKD
ncbi:ComF family protein [Candidatus Endomicrobiellum devescovinae]|uniref:ComF family protein n=1 Tax=Candidatus Endomicrobiellum devescovinae TaxID=3242322 RepID=UPI00283073C5|nr:ComF family protein [Endomicrobium sp.]